MVSIFGVGLMYWRSGKSPQFETCVYRDPLGVVMLGCRIGSTFYCQCGGTQPLLEAYEWAVIDLNSRGDF